MKPSMKPSIDETVDETVDRSMKVDETVDTFDRSMKPSPNARTSGAAGMNDSMNE